ncbi:Rid family hydrolase [Pelagicoccus sp. SDUM812002]|uniref:RidA family protein n=1 Tax=Pelagicoccus sp. SDUM812002 TaxID=3041266 RepID=UPI002810300D|nr:Rid family hydrolase [Pelagicoccus sp. SDUM812002]MDQ8185882.1 Rid family hydrolase [Pelagicoccus sp. SDUM812002]
MSLLPQHKFRYVAGLFVLAAGAYVGLRFIGSNSNERIHAYKQTSLPYADAVEVEPGSEYFYTWGVTASPRMKEIAKNSVENRYGDTYEQTFSVLAQLTKDLAEVGLSLRDVVNVRAYIVADPEPDFDGWNRAFEQFFGTTTNPHKPARTTVGISRLFHSDYRVEVEFIAVFPDGRGPHSVGTRHHERYSRLSRTETSERWKSYGRPIWPMSTGKATVADTSMFFSSSVRPASLMPNPPPGFFMYGNITQQSASLFKQMGIQLKEAGLGFEDVFFIRACVYPGKDSISKSFAAFNDEYSKFFNNSKNPNQPTRTVMSTPGFNYRNQSISIEYYAAYPEDSDKAFETARTSIGSTSAVVDSKPIAPAGVSVAADAKMVFLAGSISSIEGDMKAQATSALEALKSRVELAGGTLEDLVHLRAYIAEGDQKTLDNRIAAWEAFYRENFNGTNAPAITTLPVDSIVGNGMIELEGAAAIRP